MVMKASTGGAPKVATSTVTFRGRSFEVPEGKLLRTGTYVLTQTTDALRALQLIHVIL